MNQNMYPYDYNKPKRKNSFLILTIIFLIIAIILITAYAILNKGNKTNSNNNKIVKKTEEKIKQEPKEEIDVLKLSNNLIKELTSFSYNGDNLISNQITIYANNHIVEAKDLNNEFVYQIIINNFFYKKKEIDLNEFNMKVSEIFDDTFIFTPIDYYGKCSSNGYKLNENEKKYESIKNYNCERANISLAPYKVTKAELNNNFLLVEIKVLFTDNNRQLYYSNYEKTDLLVDVNQDNYVDYFAQGATYKFTFNKSNNGKYVFSKSEPVFSYK